MQSCVRLVKALLGHRAVSERSWLLGTRWMLGVTVSIDASGVVCCLSPDKVSAWLAVIEQAL